MGKLCGQRIGGLDVTVAVDDNADTGIVEGPGDDGPKTT